MSRQSVRSKVVGLRKRRNEGVWKIQNVDQQLLTDEWFTEFTEFILLVIYVPYSLESVPWRLERRRNTGCAQNKAIVNPIN